MNAENIAKLCSYFIAIWFDGVLGYMFLTDAAIPAGMWAIVSAANAPLGLSLGYNAVKALRK